MPIPTRAKSTNVRPTLTIPSPRPSVAKNSRDFISRNGSETVQSHIEVDVTAPNSHQVVRDSVRPTSQIRPPNLHIRNTSTVSLSASTTRSIARGPQSFPTSSETIAGQVRRGKEAANASSRIPGTNTQSSSRIQSKPDNNDASARRVRTRQPQSASTIAIRPRSVISHASDSSHTSTSKRVNENSIPQTQKDELLQLSISHFNSQGTFNEFEQHMQQSVARRYQKVAEQEANLLNLERQNQHTANLKALQSWIDTDDECTNIQQIQSLSTAIQDLTSSDLEIRYIETLRVFQLWLNRVHSVREERLGQDQASKLQFITPLGYQWQRWASEIEQRLSMIIQTLDGGRSGERKSGIAVLVDQNLMLAKVLLQEVQTAVTIERTVMLLESDWEQEQITKAADQSFTPTDLDIEVWAT